MTNRRTVLKGALSGMAGMAGLALMPTARALAQQEPTPQQVFNDPAAPVLGNPEGDVTVVEYFDYQCGYCKRDYPMVRDVVEADGNVRLVMKDWPIFGEVSVFAAQAALAAAPLGEYDTALDALMRAKGRLSFDAIEEILTGAGLSMDQLTQSVNANEQEIAGLLTRNYQQAQAFQFIGTPSFIIGKTLYPGVLKEPMLKEAIASARNEKT